MAREAATRTVMRSPGGRFAIALARDVQPGNWLPAGNAGQLTLVLTVEEPYATGPTPDEAGSVPLPQIRKVVCR